MRTAFYQFNGGINFRDDFLGVNELRDGLNLYWDGNLKKRLGYEIRNEQCTSPDTGNYPTSGLKIIDHISMRCASGSTQYFFFVSMADTAGATNAITVYYTSGNPTDTSEDFDIIGADTWSTVSTYADFSGSIIPWSTSEPFSAAVHNDKIWFGLGDYNPYVLHYRPTSGGTGGGWAIVEYPLTKLCSSGATVGSTNVITPSTSTGVDDWGGSKVIGANDKYVYVSDGRRVFYGVTEGNIRADLFATSTAIADRTSGVEIGDSGYTPGWAADQYEGLPEDLEITNAERYNRYLFLYGEQGIVSFYVRGLYSNDWDRVIETRTGVYGKAVACDKGLFFVGKDGIYGFDGVNTVDLAKKIWPEIKTENTSIPDDFDECSLAYHAGFIWISFPNGTNKQIYIFDPDLIYDDERGESHAPMYLFEYKVTTGYTARGFDHLKEFGNHLYGVNNDSYCALYELDYGGFDNTLDTKGLDTGIGINWLMRSGFNDFEEPTLQKNFKQVTLETNEGIADGTTDGAWDVQLECAIDHATYGNLIGKSTGIDLEWTSGAAHAYSLLDVPYSSDGYVLDGNTLSVGIIGETSNVTWTSGNVDIFGFKVDYDFLNESQIEVAT